MRKEHNQDPNKERNMIKSPFYNGFIMVGEKKSRKGEGATAILNLMSSTLDFLDKVDTCIEAVSNPTNRQKLEEYKGQVENMYTEMAEMSKGAIQSITDRTEDTVEDTVEEPEEVVSPVQSDKPITMINTPVVPKL